MIFTLQFPKIIVIVSVLLLLYEKEFNSKTLPEEFHKYIDDQKESVKKRIINNWESDRKFVFPCLINFCNINHFSIEILSNY